MKQSEITYKKKEISGINLFYREAGLENDKCILLLHGYPSSSHMFRELIPLLASDYHVVAPDLPGFGFSDAPAATDFEYTFDNFTKIIQLFTEAIGLEKFAIYIFDFGAPVGWRLALSDPEKITAIISQSGNAYEEGLSEGWMPLKNYWLEPTQENRDGLRMFLHPDTTKWQYFQGATNPELIAPESYTLDQYLLDRPQSAEVMLDLFKDLQTEVANFSAYQTYFKEHQPKLLAVWGKNDPFLLPQGAQAFQRDIPDAKVVLLDAGHFALETHAVEVADEIRNFLKAIR